MTDPKVVEKLLLELSRLVTHLDKMAGRPYEDYSGDYSLYLGMERALEISVQCCIDITSHIISDDDLREPYSYSDAFASLAEAGVIPKSLSQAMEGAAKFRNLLAHMYATTDPLRVYDILQGSRGDLRLFMDAIRRYITR